MEDVLGDNSKKVEHFFLTNEFNKCCPFYISLGMTYEQFWYGDPTMTKDYAESYKIKEKREAERIKWTTWEQGLYVYEAICAASPILRAFSKATKPLPYPQKPYGVDEIKNKKVDKEQKQKVQLLRTQIFFENWAKAATDRFKEKGENNG